MLEEMLKRLDFDKTKRGKVISVSGTTCIVKIDGEKYTCKLRRGISIEPNDIVFVKFPQNSNVDKYVETVLGGNETPEHLVISAEEILEKLKTVDGEGSGLDADMLDGKHGSEYALKEDMVDISMDGETIVQNINSSTAIIDDKNLSENIKDKYTKAETDTRLNTKVDKVEGKGLSTEDYTTIEKTKLSSIEDGAEKNKVNSVNNKTGDVVINKVDIDLGDVENKSSATIRNEITKANVTNALGYTPENSSNKGVANGYAPLDSNIKIPLAMLPDIAKQQTYVVETITDRDNLTGLIMGEKCYITTSGDSYIWDGTKWVTLAKADWENVNLQWTNIIGKPQSNVADIDDAASKRHTHGNKSIIDTITQTLIDRWNSAWNHISDAVRHITSAERTKWNTVDNKADTNYVDTELNKKSNKGHIHTETDISDLDKYTKAETDAKLNLKQDKLGYTPIPDTGGTIRSGDLYMDGGSVNYIRPKTTGGWARGFWWSKRDKTRIGGIGVLGNADTVTKFYLGYGESPWSGSIFEAFPNYINVNGDIKKQGVSVATINNLNKKAEKSDIPTKVGQLENDKNYVTQAELGDAGYGDMLKSIYDKNNDGIVDNAEKINGFTVETNVPANAKFTDTIYTHPSTHPASMITGLHGAATSGIADKLSIVDTRNVDNPPSYYFSQGKNMFWEFKRRTSVGNPPTNASASGTYAFILTITGWGDSSGGYPVQISVGGKNVAIRQGISTAAWSSWHVIANMEDLPTKLSELQLDTPMYHVGATPPTNKNLLWIDTSL